MGTASRATGIHDRVARGALVHALRHTVATEVVAAGASAVEIMRLLGHQSLTTSQQHTDVAAHELRSAAAGNRAHAVLRGVSSPDGDPSGADEGAPALVGVR